MKTDRQKNALIEQLKKTPIVQIACERTGISRAIYYLWRRENKNFLRQSGDALQQGIEFINDMSESQLVTLIKEKKMPAIALWLRYHHPRYGAKTPAHTPASFAGELSKEEAKIVAKALRLASGGASKKQRL